jgi:hypothetical protein
VLTVLPNFLLVFLGLLGCVAQHAFQHLPSHHDDDDGDGSGLGTDAATMAGVLDPSMVASPMVWHQQQQRLSSSFGLFPRLIVLALLVLSNRIAHATVAPSLPQKHYTPLLEQLLLGGCLLVIFAGIWSSAVAGVVQYRVTAGATGGGGAIPEIANNHTAAAATAAADQLQALKLFFVQRQVDQLRIFQFWVVVDACMMAVLTVFWLAVHAVKLAPYMNLHSLHQRVCSAATCGGRLVWLGGRVPWFGSWCQNWSNGSRESSLFRERDRQDGVAENLLLEQEGQTFTYQDVAFSGACFGQRLLQIKELMWVRAERGFGPSLPFFSLPFPSPLLSSLPLPSPLFPSPLFPSLPFPLLSALRSPPPPLLLPDSPPSSVHPFCVCLNGMHV